MNLHEPVGMILRAVQYYEKRVEKIALIYEHEVALVKQIFT